LGIQPENIGSKNSLVIVHLNLRTAIEKGPGARDGRSVFIDLRIGAIRIELGMVQVKIKGIVGLPGLIHKLRRRAAILVEIFIIYPGMRAKQRQFPSGGVAGLILGNHKSVIGTCLIEPLELFTGQRLDRGNKSAVVIYYLGLRAIVDK